MKVFIFIALFLVSSVAAEPIVCKDDTTTLHGTSGTFQINLTIGCQIEAESTFFGINTQNLNLLDGEYILVNPGTRKEKEFSIFGPVKVNYYVFDSKVRMSFNLAKKEGSILIDYFQSDPKDAKDIVPISLGSRYSSSSIKYYGERPYQLQVSALETKMHLQVLSSGDSFNHYLVNEKESKNIPVSGDTDSIVSTPVDSNCSNTYTAKDKDMLFQIQGPVVETIKAPYRCVNLFNFAQTKTDGSHFDVDFAYFTITDQNDQLTIDDGHQAFIASGFSKLQPVISFQGPNLAVIYDSPRVVKPKSGYKLTITAQTFGGVISGYQQLTLPPSGLVRYTLRPSDPQSYGVLEIDGQLGVDLAIYDSQKNVITIAGGDFNPPLVALPQNAVLEFNVKSKTSATVNYKQNKCSGTIFGNSGSVSITGGNQTCYWLIGAKSTIRIDAHNLQGKRNCLKIFSLDNQKPILEQCDLNPGLVLPPITLGPAYLKIETSSDDSRFAATISNALEDRTLSSVGSQTRYSSANYPLSYSWNPFKESFSIDAKNKSVVLSVVDVDIRKGEELSVGTTEVNSGNYVAFGDFDLSNTVTNVTISRSLGTNDFGIHKGYSLVTTAYQKIINAKVSQSSISTEKNQTSLLLRIEGSEKDRIAYSITNVTSGNQDFQMNVIDSRSVMGRQVPDEEKYTGSTTSNALLISLTTVKANTTLPQLKIAFNQVLCNQTIDHVCDQSTRCVPAAKLCKGKSYCLDGSDLHVQCSSGPAPKPPVVPGEGYGGFTVFFLSILMFSLGVIAAIYGPDAYKNIEGRFRSGQYTTFTSTE